MILVVGGLGAGKRKFIREELGYAPEQLSSVPEEGTPVLWGLEALDPLPPLEDLLGREVVACREVGCGVVPMDRADRDRREAIGRLCCDLAARAEAVSSQIEELAEALAEQLEKYRQTVLSTKDTFRTSAEALAAMQPKD